MLDAVVKSMGLRKNIVTEARTWLGTPWYHNQCLKGIGCDCVNFPHAVYKASGVPMPDLFNYSRTPKGEKILNYLDDCLKLIGTAEDLYDWSDRYKDKTLPLQDLIDKSQPGDLLVYSRVFNAPPGHLAIKTDYGKIETLFKQGVTETVLNSELNLLAVYSVGDR